jgi:hypothetical protein
MSTKIRAEVSKDNKYYISKHRFYELKHFCLQYPEWKAKYTEYNSLVTNTTGIRSGDISDPVSYAAEHREKYFHLMQMVEQTCIAADADIYQWLLKAVAYGVSYTALKMEYDIPCGKDMFYDRYRKFFWLLDKIREKNMPFNSQTIYQKGGN